MFLAVAALLLLIVIGVQNYLYPPLREETISDGLYGPYHWFLDGAYVILATAMGLAFWHSGLTSQILSIGAAAALLTTAFTNTFSSFVDRVTHGLHSKLHTWFTVAMFIFILSLETVNDHGWMYVLTLASVTLPLTIAGFIAEFRLFGLAAGPAAEKLAVFLMCTWMIAWAV